MSDPRLTPARADVAAAHLKGKVQAERFVEGVEHQAIVGAAAVRKTPAPDGRLETQLLFGETFIVFDRAHGFAWGQSGHDQYVGYIAERDLAAPAVEPTHRVTALRTFAFAGPDLKTEPLLTLSLNCKVRIEAQEGRYARVAYGGWVFEGHLGPMGAKDPDWVATAERFVGAPYLWGGKESLGTDCSGLIQSALEAAGVRAPRDTDMQEQALGKPAPLDLSALQRGDLIFWKGHVGVMLDGARLLHANAHHMQTAIEPIKEAAARIEAAAGPITSIKRL